MNKVQVDCKAVVSWPMIPRRVGRAPSSEMLSNQPITRTTSRLEIRALAHVDLADLYVVNSDPEVTRFLPYPCWSSPADGENWFARMQAFDAIGTSQQLVLVHRLQRKVIGTLLLFNHDAAHRRIEIGYVLARAYWGQGYMSEALQSACAFVFTELGLGRIEAEVHPENHTSNQLLIRLGFTLEGKLRQRWINRGVAEDAHIYGYVVDDWQRSGGNI